MICSNLNKVECKLFNKKARFKNGMGSNLNKVECK